MGATTTDGPRTVDATRYVAPLREGGSLPALVEAEDDGLYVLKFRGAGQGPKALIAELLAGELGRGMGLPIPEIVFVTLDRSLAIAEPDPEIHDLLVGSTGLNLGLDFLPGSLAYDPASTPPPAAELASDIVWFDAFVMNVDRSARNTNLLTWHRQLYLIDHGASLYFHHDWAGEMSRSGSSFPAIRDHVLLPLADDIAGARERLAPLVTDALIDRVTALIPDTWIDAWGGAAPGDVRKAYAAFLRARRDAAGGFTQEAIRAQS